MLGPPDPTSATSSAPHLAWNPQICRVETRAPCAPEPSLTVISSPSRSLGCPPPSPRPTATLVPTPGSQPVVGRQQERGLSGTGQRPPCSKNVVPVPPSGAFCVTASVCRAASRGTSVVRRESRGSGPSVGPQQWTAWPGHGPAGVDCGLPAAGDPLGLRCTAAPRLRQPCGTLG